MQPIRLCIFSGRRFEETFENTQWRKVKQMQSMRLCIFSGKQFEATFENTQWRKVKQMQPMRLYILTDMSFEDTNENTQWRNPTQMQPVHYRLRAIRGGPLGVVNFASHFKQNSYFHFLIQLFLLKSL